MFNVPSNERKNGVQPRKYSVRLTAKKPRNNALGMVPRSVTVMNDKADFPLVMPV